jgi:hypothetical protein
MHPTDHMSTAVEYSLAPISISGALMFLQLNYNLGEEGDSPVPKSDYELCHAPNSNRITIPTGQTKVSHLNSSTIVH